MDIRQRRACRQALEQVFGVREYRPGQKAAASCLLSGRDLLCILPTGAGKSLCWQLPAVVHEGLTVVVSPLIALMQDQVKGLMRRGIPAVTLNSMMDAGEQREALRQIRAGESRILFVSPERLVSGGMMRLMEQMKPWLLVVDEAHCVVQWGDSFRESYRHIGDFVSRLSFRPVICAMTATADDVMQRRIVHSLRMHRQRRVMLGVVRGNLAYTMRTTTARTGEILRMMQENPCRTVVFCRTRVRTEQLADAMCRAGIPAAHYHAGMGREERTIVQDAFAQGNLLALAATTAFGMGVDIPDVRRVIHDFIPGSITDLVQQSGRAGRDGKDAECIILISPQELAASRMVLLARRLQAGWRPLQRLKVFIRDWLPMRQVLALLLGGGCIQAGIAAAFGQRAAPCGRCSACCRGAPCQPVPDLLHMKEAELLMWLMLWQRSVLAERRGVKPEDVISRDALRRLVQGDDEPPGVPAQTLRHFIPLASSMVHEEVYADFPEREK